MWGDIHVFWKGKWYSLNEKLLQVSRKHGFTWQHLVLPKQSLWDCASLLKCSVPTTPFVCNSSQNQKSVWKHPKEYLKENHIKHHVYTLLYTSDCFHPSQYHACLSPRPSFASGETINETGRVPEKKIHGNLPCTQTNNLGTKHEFLMASPCSPMLRQMHF